MLVPDVPGQTLGRLDDGQGVHAREPCCHPSTQASSSELDAYNLTWLELDVQQLPHHRTYAGGDVVRALPLHQHPEDR